MLHWDSENVRNPPYLPTFLYISSVIIIVIIVITTLAGS